MAPRDATPDDAPLTRCEWCGAEYAPPAAPAPAPRAPAGPPAGVGEAADTRCEWCGAEYPPPPAG